MSSKEGHTLELATLTAVHDASHPITRKARVLGTPASLTPAKTAQAGVLPLN